MAVRMNLEMAKVQTLEEVRKDFNEQLALLTNEYFSKGRRLELEEIYVFVTSSNKRYKCTRRYNLWDLDMAVEFFVKISKVKCKRLFIGFGVEYNIDGNIEGACDLVITGTDY